MNWYFALSGASIDRDHHGWRDMIRVAVHSAKRNTTLKPHLIYDGKDSPFITELRLAGVTVLSHRVTFYDALRDHAAGHQAYLDVAAGAFLRFDIPLLENREAFALYTDCDVLFLQHPVFDGADRPALFSATSQSAQDPATDMNSGVMVINTKAMRHDYGNLVDFTRQNLMAGLDQEILRLHYSGRYQPMDRSLNWKPYWGPNSDAQIVHFHGPKPDFADAMRQGTVSNSPPEWEALYGWSPEGYEKYCDRWRATLASYLREQAFNAAASGDFPR